METWWEERRENTLALSDAGCSKVKYRLLQRGETIEQCDQVLADDTVTWLPLAGWEVGREYDPGVYMPVRRECS